MNLVRPHTFFGDENRVENSVLVDRVTLSKELSILSVSLETERKSLIPAVEEAIDNEEKLEDNIPRSSNLLKESEENTVR